MYLGAIGGLGYMGYTIYLLRTPHEQLEADPTKKTLVILGMLVYGKQSFNSNLGIAIDWPIGTGWGAVSLLKKLDTGK